MNEPKESLEEMDAQELLDDEENKGEEDKDDNDDDAKDDGDEDDKKDNGDDNDRADDSDDSDDDNKDDEEDKKQDGLEDAANQLKKDNPLADIPDDWTPKTYKELLEKSMEITKQAIDTEQRATKDAEAKAEKEKTDKIAEIQSAYDKEIENMVKDGRVPEVKDKDNTDDEGVKRQTQVWKFIKQRNDEAKKQGSSYMIYSFEQGLDLLELKERKDRDAEITKKKGGMVGSGSAGRDSSKSSGGYVRGQSLDDIIIEEQANM